MVRKASTAFCKSISVGLSASSCRLRRGSRTSTTLIRKRMTRRVRMVAMSRLLHNRCSLSPRRRAALRLRRLTVMLTRSHPGMRPVVELSRPVPYLSAADLIPHRTTVFAPNFGHCRYHALLRTVYTYRTIWPSASAVYRPNCPALSPLHGDIDQIHI